jgi:hypothetical protein
LSWRDVVPLAILLASFDRPDALDFDYVSRNSGGGNGMERHALQAAVCQ